jgi:uncharacterized protein (TIGR02271 family)
MKTVIGLFDDRAEAMSAYAALVEEGFAKADLDILTNDDKDDEPKLVKMRSYVKQPDLDVYLRGVAEGGTIITANVVDSAAERAASIMSNFRMVNIVERAKDWNVAIIDTAQDEDVLQVIEEDLNVGVGEVERGRMRIYSVVTEREVQKNVGLRDETIRIKRRPVNRAVAISPDLFQERSFEMVEVDEIALVSKTARVVEEVALEKDVVEKIETIKETLRRQDVEVEEVPVARSFADYENDFRGFYTAKLVNSGVSYDELRPAFNYGYVLATKEPFRSAPWSALEVDGRKLWEEKNPGTWDQNKAVIKYAYQWVRGER